MMTQDNVTSTSTSTSTYNFPWPDPPGLSEDIQELSRTIEDFSTALHEVSGKIDDALQTLKAINATVVTPPKPEKSPIQPDPAEKPNPSSPTPQPSGPKKPEDTKEDENDENTDIEEEEDVWAIGMDPAIARKKSSNRTHWLTSNRTHWLMSCRSGKTAWLWRKVSEESHDHDAVPYGTIDWKGLSQP